MLRLVTFILCKCIIFLVFSWQFYGVMTAVYTIYAFAWIVMMACSYKDLVRLQFWVLAVILLGFLEKMLFVSEYGSVNTGHDRKSVVLSLSPLPFFLSIPLSLSSLHLAPSHYPLLPSFSLITTLPSFSPPLFSFFLFIPLSLSVSLCLHCIRLSLIIPYPPLSFSLFLSLYPSLSLSVFIASGSLSLIIPYPPPPSPLQPLV